MAPFYPASRSQCTQTATGGKRSTVTNETGNYVLASLPVGPYVLEAVLPGFRSYVQTGIVLQVDASPMINVVLQIGQASEQVEVAADAGTGRNAYYRHRAGRHESASRGDASQWTRSS